MLGEYESRVSYTYLKNCSIDVEFMSHASGMNCWKMRDLKMGQTTTKIGENYLMRRTKR